MSKIYNAVRDCIAQCHHSPTPYLAVNEFCTSLRTNPTWTAEDIEEVQAGAWRLLSAVLHETHCEPL